MTNSPVFSVADHQYMSLALREAAKGLYGTSPNPRVGCVIVNNNQIVGIGAHLRAGEPHAEVHALRMAGPLAEGADAYVTLEPCSHFGRTPPCADALVQAGVKRVVAAMQDPNPLVAGNGLRRLAEHGISVADGLLEVQAKELNAGFISRMTRQRPWVRSKIAASLDGKTGLSNGESKWITGAAAREHVQQWRAQSCAILTGIGTVLADDPLLTVRNKELLVARHGIQPWRVIVDSQLRTSPSAAILQAGRVLIAHATDSSPQAQKLQENGAELIDVPDASGKVDLASLLRILAERQINEVMVEAGAILNGSLLQAELLDELLLYYAPTLLGGEGRDMFEMAALQSMQDKIVLQPLETRAIGADWFVRARPFA